MKGVHTCNWMHHLGKETYIPDKQITFLCKICKMYLCRDFQMQSHIIPKPQMTSNQMKHKKRHQGSVVFIVFLVVWFVLYVSFWNNEVKKNLLIDWWSILTIQKVASYRVLQKMAPFFFLVPILLWLVPLERSVEKCNLKNTKST